MCIRLENVAPQRHLEANGTNSYNAIVLDKFQ